MINGFFVTDAHCHIYPEKIAPVAVAGINSFYDEHAVYKGTAEDLISKGTAEGIDRFIVQSAATTPKQVKSINDFIAAEVAKNDQRLVGLGTLHPDSEDIKGDIEHLIELGLKGVKLHPDIQRFKIDDYRCLKIYELCEEKKLPILMHTGDSRFDFSNPNRLVPVLKIYTSLTVIGAHLGGWSVWNEAAEKCQGMPNLYFDCSSCFPYINKYMVKDIIRAYGVDRVLFGTDYPMWDLKKEINTIMSLDLDETEIKCILNNNAAKIFNLE